MSENFPHFVKDINLQIQDMWGPKYERFKQNN